MTNQEKKDGTPSHGVSQDVRTVAIPADGKQLGQDIMYVPLDPTTGVGGWYEYRDGQPLGSLAIQALAAIGAIG